MSDMLFKQELLKELIDACGVCGVCGKNNCLAAKHRKVARVLPPLIAKASLLRVLDVTATKKALRSDKIGGDGKRITSTTEHPNNYTTIHRSS